MNKSRLSIVYRAHPVVMMVDGGGKVEWWLARNAAGRGANVGRAWTDFSKTINAK